LNGELQMKWNVAEYDLKQIKAKCISRQGNLSDGEATGIFLSTVLAYTTFISVGFKTYLFKAIRGWDQQTLSSVTKHEVMMP
jgi:hypothetical protein